PHIGTCPELPMVRPTIPNHLVNAARWTWVRLRSRRLWRVTAVVSVTGALLIGYEASFRARLGSPESRLATELYTRPIMRGSDEPETAIPFGQVETGAAEFRIPVRLDQVTDHMVQAVLAVEDQRFREHEGLDFRRIAGAALANLKHGAIAQGGSTITQ